MGYRGSLANVKCSLSPNFTHTSHLTPLNKNPRSPSYSSKTSLLHFSSRAISLATQFQNRPEKKMKQLLSPVLLLILFLHCTRTTGQSSAPAPAPAGPTNITAVLEKAGQYTTFIRLLKSTQMDDRINIQLNNSNQGLTLFAPTDNAFSNLKPGTLNSFTDQQKAQLVQFHVVSSFISMSQFQTVSNPVSTQAGGGNSGDFSLNITTSGNQVNMTSGLTNTSVANTVYTDGQLAVYQIDQVLLPMGVVRPSAPPPETPKPKKAGSPSDAPSDSTPASADSSDATRLWFPRNPPITLSFAVAVAAALPLWL